MNNRTKRLYIAVTVIWILLITWCAVVAYARTDGQPVTVDDGHGHGPGGGQSALPADVLPAEMTRAQPAAALAVPANPDV